MTDLLYMESVDAQYLKEFEATVEEVAGDHLVLDRTAFYPEGGGQPTDQGVLEVVDAPEGTEEGGEGADATQEAAGDGPRQVQVARVTKKGGVRHFVAGSPTEAGLAEGARVRGVLDWDRRFAHMRMHTAQHLVSGLVYDEFGARTVGNQIHAGYSRIDFDREGFTDEELAHVEDLVNDVVARDVPLETTVEARDVVEEQVDPKRVNLDLIPKGIKELRVVRIGDVDLCPCAGTHVRSTGEIGEMAFERTRSKGAGRTRVVYRLED